MQLSWQARPISSCHAMPFHFIVRIRPQGGAAVVQYKPTSVQRTRTRTASAPAPHLHPPDQTGVSESGPMDAPRWMPGEIVTVTRWKSINICGD